MILPDRLLVRAELLKNHGVEGLNANLAKAGLGRPLPDLTIPETGSARYVAVPVAGSDLDAVLEVLRQTADEPGDVLRDVRFGATTTGAAKPGRFELLGEKTGHGVADAAWTPVDATAMGPQPEWRALDDRPVIALLDSGVLANHPWLPQPVDGQPFVHDADGWAQVRALDVPALPPIGKEPNLGSHLGHGTFIAGIIRRVAPDAQVLSVKVMDALGQVNEENVIAALEWLTGYGGRVDVVLMAFGRRVENGDDRSDSADRVKKAIDALAGRGVRVVMSAGNAATTDPVFPACYAPLAGPGVTSVGGGLSKDFPEEYSSRGPWVTDWRLGGEVVSLMPLTPEGEKLAGAGYAQWTGTSFSAAIFAGELAADASAS